MSDQATFVPGESTKKRLFLLRFSGREFDGDYAEVEEKHYCMGVSSVQDRADDKKGIALGMAGFAQLRFGIAIPGPAPHNTRQLCSDADWSGLPGMQVDKVTPARLLPWRRV